jgi:hypothetical protein
MHGVENVKFVTRCIFRISLYHAPFQDPKLKSDSVATATYEIARLPCCLLRLPRIHGKLASSGITYVPSVVKWGKGAVAGDTGRRR